MAENALDHESDAGMYCIAFAVHHLTDLLSTEGYRHVLPYLIVRMSHNEAELFIHVCTNQKPNTCLTSEASIIICHLQDDLADRSWYDGCHAANHACCVELEYHASLTISARVSSYELSVIVVRCQAREMGGLACAATGDLMRNSLTCPNTRLRMTSTDDTDRTQLSVAFEYMNMLPNCYFVIMLDTSCLDPSNREASNTPYQALSHHAIAHKHSRPLGYPVHCSLDPNQGKLAHTTPRLQQPTGRHVIQSLAGWYQRQRLP